MARPDGRAFCALWAQGRRAAAHSGGPRPSRPASASLRPRSGRGPAGGPRGPGLGPALPTRRPRGLVPLTARRGMPALRAGGGSRPRPLGASLPPPAACGPLPLPTLGGLGAARPARLRRSGICGGWSPPSAAQVAPLRGLPAASRCSGAPPRAARPSPLRGRAPRGLAPLLPLAGRGVGAPGRPAPTRGGFLGGAALRPGRARLRPAAPRWPACGSACAGAALPPLGPPGVAAPPRSRRPAAKPRGGVRALWARPVRGRNFYAARKGLARFAGRGPVPRFARGWGAGVRRLRAGRPHRSTSGKAKTSRLRRALPDDLRRGKGGQGDAAPCGRSPTPQNPPKP